MKIKKYIKLFFISSIIITAYGFLNTIKLDSIYISSATLEPKKSLTGDSNMSPISGYINSTISSGLFSGSSKSDDLVLALELVKSKDFFEELLKSKEFKDKLNKPNRTNFLRTYTKEPSPEMLTFDNMHSRFLKNHFSIRHAEKTNIVTIRISHYEAETAKNWLETIILKLNLKIRDMRVTESKKIVELLEKELSKQSVPEIRYSLSNLMAKEIRSIALAGLGDEFVLRVVDSPRIPNKRARPSRAVNVISWFVLSIILSSVLVIVLHRLSIHRKWM